MHLNLAAAAALCLCTSLVLKRTPLMACRLEELIAFDCLGAVSAVEKQLKRAMKNETYRQELLDHHKASPNTHFSAECLITSCVQQGLCMKRAKQMSCYFCVLAASMAATGLQGIMNSTLRTELRYYKSGQCVCEDEWFKRLPAAQILVADSRKTPGTSWVSSHKKPQRPITSWTDLIDQGFTSLRCQCINCIKTCCNIAMLSK